MTRLFFENLWINETWVSDVGIDINAKGDITAIEPSVSSANADHHRTIGLPGLPNVHSHAFQRAMAGRAEVKGTSDDSFWTWRKVMYKFLERLTPEDVAAIATMTYCEMLESGFTSVCEFHYLHHAPDGTLYDDIGEMASALIDAAKTTGIGQTLLPVFYANSQFGGAAPTDDQRRFVNNPDQFGDLVNRVNELASDLPDPCVGVAPHSLRAVTPESLDQILALNSGGPIHIHIAEQIKEVDDCLAWSGQRPVDWLLDHQDVDARWCLVHATHLTPTELGRFASTQAVAGLCPITEANLGDGLFSAVEFLHAGGRMAIGSDSNVLISATEELRLLEYGQRLHSRGRNVLPGDHASTGQSLYAKALRGGAQAAGRKIGKLAVGSRADIISLDRDHPALCALDSNLWLDGWVFAASSPAVTDVWVGGKHLVKDGCHLKRNEIRKQYAKTMKRLLA